MAALESGNLPNLTTVIACERLVGEVAPFWGVEERHPGKIRPCWTYRLEIATDVNWFGGIPCRFGNRQSLLRVASLLLLFRHLGEAQNTRLMREYQATTPRAANELRAGGSPTESLTFVRTVLLSLTGSEWLLAELANGFRCHPTTLNGLGNSSSYRDC